jgi:hypothetical protein
MAKHWEKWNDPAFVSLMNAIKGRTVLRPLKVYTLWELAKSCANLEGDAAEFGVYRGGVARIISSVMRPKTTHLFDTFQGLPKPGEFDQMREGALAANETEVRKFLKNSSVEFHVGFFPDTTKGLEDKRFCFVHSDADLYESTKAACEFFYPRLTPGAIMLFDDYGFSATQGCTKAVDEFFASKPENIIYLTTCHAFIIKQP